MNTNIFRTALTWAAIVIPLLSTFFGCASDAVSGAVNCSASWLPPQYAVLVSSGLLVLNQIIKAFDGTGLFKPVQK
jgi:hypothetical protein